MSGNFILKKEKMHVLSSSLDLIIVSLPKYQKENGKIVNVRTEVAGGLSKPYYLKEMLYQLGHQQTIGLEAFHSCKGPT